MTDEVAIGEAGEHVELSYEQKRARRRVQAQQAIALAMQGRWEEALTANGEILDMFPEDPEASNRVANALSELNRVDEAIEAYERTLNAQPTNPIAQRNLLRLRKVAEAGNLGPRASQKLPPAFFVEEVGKTGITTLTDLSGPELVARVAAGDEVNLKAYRNTLQVTVLDGTVLGKVERGLAERLIRLIKSGNKYQAGVVMAEPARLRILVRETVQAPQNEGRISFPPRTASVRAYTRETLLRRAGGDDEDLEVDASDVEAQDIDDEDENPAEFGFSETSLAGERETT